MFERYTEKARRVIFFARYEASQFGSAMIDTEHLLLGLLRENQWLTEMLPPGAHETIRAQIGARTAKSEKASVSIDLPLSNAAKRVLAYAAEEAEHLNHRHIGTEHLFLGLFREKNCIAAELLEPFSLKLEHLRKKFETSTGTPLLVPVGTTYRLGPTVGSTIQIHDTLFDLQSIREAVQRCRGHNWYWGKASYKPRDCVIDRHTRNVSLDTGLSKESARFELVKDGWNKDHCAVCRWELFESTEDPAHGVGYTNGRDWLCTECYEKFWDRPNFISGSYSDLT